MRIKTLKDKDVSKLSDILAPKLTKNRFFVFVCPDESEREAFIAAYLKYNIPRWLEHGDYVLTDDNFDVLIILTSARRSSHKFSGKGAKRLKKFKTAPTIFYYRGNLAYITHLIAPRNKRLKVMSIYSAPDSAETMLSLVDEAIALAIQYDFNLMYDTLTRRYLEDMEKKGFVVSYQKMFANTTYVQTLMMLNRD